MCCIFAFNPVQDSTASTVLVRYKTSCNILHISPNCLSVQSTVRRQTDRQGSIRKYPDIETWKHSSLPTDLWLYSHDITSWGRLAGRHEPNITPAVVSIWMDLEMEGYFVLHIFWGGPGSWWLLVAPGGSWWLLVACGFCGFYGSWPL